MTTTPSTLSQEAAWPAGALPEKWIERLFAEMSMTYGRKFTDQWGGQDPHALKRFWATKLAGFTGEELKRGVATLQLREWPPTLPEFVKLCRPSVDVLAAYYEAVAGVTERAKGNMGEWSHPAIF